MGLALSLLVVAITTEVAATAALPRTEGFHDPGWTALVIGGYAISIWLLSVTSSDSARARSLAPLMSSARRDLSRAVTAQRQPRASTSLASS